MNSSHCRLVLCLRSYGLLWSWQQIGHNCRLWKKAAALMHGSWTGRCGLIVRKGEIHGRGNETSYVSVLLSERESTKGTRPLAHLFDVPHALVCKIKN